MVKRAIGTSSLILRHLIASVVSIVAPIILMIVTYLVLLAVAIIMNSGWGSPVALPFWALFALIVAIAYTSLLLFPSVLIAEIISRRFGKWQQFAQIPISTVVLATIIIGLSLTLHRVHIPGETIALLWADYPFHAILLLMIPLGLYWWTAKIVQAGIAIPAELLKRLGIAMEKAREEDQEIAPEL